LLGHAEWYFQDAFAMFWPTGIWLARLASGEFPLWMHTVEASLYRATC